MLVQITSAKDKDGRLLNRGEKLHFRGIDLNFDKNGVAVEEVSESDLELLMNLGMTWTQEITAMRLRQTGSDNGASKIDRLYMESLEERIVETSRERDRAVAHAQQASRWADEQKGKIEALEQKNAEQVKRIEDLEQKNGGLAHDLKRANEEVERLKGELEKAKQPQSQPARPNTPALSQPSGGGANKPK